MVAHVIKCQLCFRLACFPLIFHLSASPFSISLFAPSFQNVSFSFVLPFPVSFLFIFLPSKTEFCILSKFYHIAASLFCWLSAERLLSRFWNSVNPWYFALIWREDQSQIISPRHRIFYKKTPRWRMLSGHNMIVDKEWAKLFTKLPVTIYWVLGAVGIDMSKAWSLPARHLKYSTENTASFHMTLIKADVWEADLLDKH